MLLHHKDTHWSEGLQYTHVHTQHPPAPQCFQAPDCNLVTLFQLFKTGNFKENIENTHNNKTIKKYE